MAGLFVLDRKGVQGVYDKMYKHTAELWHGHVSLVCPKQKYAPSVFEKYVTTISLGGKEIQLNLYDTAGKTLWKNSD